MLVGQLRLARRVQILDVDRRIMASARATEVGRRPMGISGVGPLLASALVATIPNPHGFRSGRNLAAWIGLVPREVGLLIEAVAGKQELANAIAMFVRGTPRHASHLHSTHRRCFDLAAAAS
jgi:transposase